MKYYLFIDNFRGFINTFIPITDVNFLVGQNSTGKTSVLGLMKLLSGVDLLLSNSNGFSEDPVNFGNFSDMVSAHSPNQRSFRIGAVWEPPPATKKKTGVSVMGHLLTFVDDDGVPRLSRYTFCNGSTKISIAYKKQIHYCVEDVRELLTVEMIMNDLLPAWVKEHSREASSPSYSKLILPRELAKATPPLFFALSLAWEISKSKRRPNDKTPRKEKEGDQFPSPGGMINPDVTWIAPIRTKPKRTYDEVRPDFSPEGEHTPYMIRRILKSKSAAKKFSSFIKRVGKESSLFQDVKIKHYGRTRFELDVILDGKSLNILNVGYGVSQSLPVLAEIIARDHGAWFAIQQPEVHLHPRAQAALGDIFFEMAILDHKMFLVETHSDFTIDRFRMNYKKDRAAKPASQILFFERRDRHNVVTSLPIGPAGDLPVDQPASYRDFFIREELRLLQL